jgi:hypothetical protein
MAFEHRDKSPGDLIRSADWNALGGEVQRLGADKVDRSGGDTIGGPLSVRGDFTVGAANAGAAVRVLRRQEDAGEATHGALVLGTDAESSASLRLGYGPGYSWIQGRGQPSLALNPRGGNVGVGVAAPQAPLHVGGNALVGGALGFGSTTRQMLNLWGTQYAAGVQNATLYLRTDSHFALYRGGAHDNATLNPGGGNVLLAALNTGNVGVGTAAPASRLSVAGGASVGAGYAGTAAPSNGLIVEGRLGVGVASPAGTLDVGGDVVLGGPAGQRFILHTRRNGAGDFIQLTVDAAGGAWEWGKGITLRRDTGNVGIGMNNPRSPLDTGKGVMSGAPNDYMKAQFTLSGGGNVTWNAGRLGWSQRFIAISANRGTAHSAGHINITQPTANIPAEFVYDGAARSVTPAGVALTAWEALYAVHAVGAGENEVSFRIVRYTHSFDAPSNWILVGVVNADLNRVKLGTGDFIGFAHTIHGGDLRFGHPSRSGSVRPGVLGRALVDETNVLSLNYAADWPGGVKVYGRLQTASGRAIASATNKVDLGTSNWVDLAGMQVSLATTGNPVLVLFKTGGVQLVGVQTGRVRFRLLVNNAEVAMTLHEFHNKGWELRDVTLNWLWTPGAGTQNIRVQWHNEGGTVSCCWYNDMRTLIAVEL